MSRYLDLLKQIPPGNEEISEILIKKLNNAACALVNNQAGQYDLTEEERRDYADYEPPEMNDRMQKWGLLDKWPLQLGELMICEDREHKEWLIGISFNSNPYLWFKSGSKKDIIELGNELIELRETEGEEAFQDEIMGLVETDMRRDDI